MSLKKKGKKKKEINIETPKKDFIDLTKELPIYNGTKEEEKNIDNKNKSSKNNKPLKINGYQTKRIITKTQIDLLKSKFNEFYKRTVEKNIKYFEPKFIDSISKLKNSINNLKVSNLFSNSFLQWYNDLKSARHEAKKYIKKIESVFEQARQNKNTAPNSSSADYKYGSFIDFENNTTGDKLKKEEDDLFYFISEATELKEKISNYHPITREMENLSLAKSCEHYWKEYVEKYRELQQSQGDIKNLIPNGAVSTEQTNKLDTLKKDIDSNTKNEKEAYESALEMLTEALNNKKPGTPNDLPKEDRKKLNETLESWNKRKNDLKKYDDIGYQSKLAATLRKWINKGTSGFSRVVNKFFGIQSDIDKANSLLKRYDFTKS